MIGIVNGTKIFEFRGQEELARGLESLANACGEGASYDTIQEYIRSQG